MFANLSFFIIFVISFIVVVFVSCIELLFAHLLFSFFFFFFGKILTIEADILETLVLVCQVTIIVALLLCLSEITAESFLFMYGQKFLTLSITHVFKLLNRRPQSDFGVNGRLKSCLSDSGASQM